MYLKQDDLFNIIRKSTANARSLFDDAVCLRTHNRIDRAYTLLQLSIEESGKALLTFGLLLSDNFSNETIQKTFLKNFKKHQTKTAKAINLDSMLFDSIKDSETKRLYAAFLHQKYKDVPHMDEMKNLSLYVSIHKGKIVQPSDIITKELVEDIQFWANLRCMGVEKMLPIVLENFDDFLAAWRSLDKEKWIRETAAELFADSEDVPGDRSGRRAQFHPDEDKHKAG